MNKKADGRTIFLTCSFIGLFICIGMIVHLNTSPARDDACKEIGLYESTYYNNNPACNDIKGNIYFVDMDCNIIETKCTARSISIGGVRIV